MNRKQRRQQQRRRPAGASQDSDGSFVVDLPDGTSFNIGMPALIVGVRPDGDLPVLILQCPTDEAAPERLGILFADLVRHHANHLSDSGAFSKEEAVLRIAEMITRELHAPTADPKGRSFVKES